MVATRVSTRKSNERPKRQRRASSKFDNSSSNDKDDKPEPPAPRTKDMKPKSNKTTDNKKKNAKAASAPVKGKAVAKVESTATKKKKAPPQDNTKTASKGKGKNNDHKKTSASKNTKKKTKAAAKLEAANKSDNNTDDSSTSFEQKEARVKLRVDGALSKGFRYALLDSSKSENEDDVPKPKSSAAKRKEPSTKQTNDDDNSTNRNQDIRVSVKLDKEVGVRVKVAKKQMKGKQLAVVNDHDLSEGSSDGGQLVATRKKPPKITIRMGKGKKKKEEGEEQEEEEVAVAPSTTKEEEIDDVIDDVTEPKEGETVESTPKTEVATTKTDATETSDKKRARDEEETNEEEKVAEEVAEEEKAPPAKKARVSQFGNSVDPKRLCIMDGCDKYKKARCGGYCLFHYDALSDEERAEIIKENELKKMKMAPEKKRCKVEGCGKYFKARHDGMCLTCYREFHGITKNGPSNFSGGELPPVEMIGGVDEQTLSMMLPPVMNEICVPAVASRAPSGPKPAKYCIFEGCMKYKQKGCLGYCLTHKEFGDPELHRLQKETAAAESALKRKSVSKSSLCKVEGCEKYKQANCNGYCLEHVKTLAAYDDDDLEYVTKVRVRCDTRLQNGFCVAILSEESRDKLGLKRPLPLSDEDEVSDDPMPDEDDEVSDDPMLDEDEGDKVDEDVEMEQNDDEDEQEPAAEETAAPTLGEPDFEISNVIRRKENGALLCKAVGCLKIAQTKDDGFCRTHYNRFQISTGRIESWQCKCGERIAISSLRCGKCHRWKDGHHPSSSPQRSLAPSSARTCVPADAGVEISDVLPSPPPQQQQQQLPQITIDDIPLEMREAFLQLEPDQQALALEMLAQQKLEQQRQMEEEVARPDEHFLTVALNGTILGATEMVTGFPPSSLLMTSVFDSIHDDDLLGLHAIKTHFWERDQPDVTVYLRRRSVDNTYIWLKARVVSYIDSPVPGIIIQEQFIHEDRDGNDNDDDSDVVELGVARMVSRVTRIAALLLQAVETALFEKADRRRNSSFGNEDDLNIGNSSENANNGDNVDGGGAAEIQAMLMEAAEKMGVDLSSADNPFRELMQAGGVGIGSSGNGIGGNSNNGAGGTNNANGDDERSRKKNTDPLDYLKTGAILDLSKIILSEGDVKLITLVLSGRLQIEDIGPLLYLALNSPGMDLVAATDEFYQLSEQQLIANSNAQSPSQVVLLNPPPLAVINLSYTDIGDYGMEALSEFLYSNNSALKTVDLSFCNINTQGFLSLCHGLRTRTSRGLPQIEALVLAGNTIQDNVGKQLGLAISSTRAKQHKRKSGHEGSPKSYSNSSPEGIKLLHLGSTSITMKCLTELLSSLGPTCPLQELKLQSNRIGSNETAVLVKFLEGKSENGSLVLPKLNRLDMSYNELGDTGTTKLTRAISKRSKIHMTELSISGNDIRPKGIESIMNKLLQHKLLTLNLDNNSIGDQGCQLVAASLQSIPSLHRLNLGFNDIGCRGIATLMRSLVGCESITSLGLSGNVMRVSGAIAMGFTLAQHPRLSELELDNCCLSQVAQCHIAAGIISNRWVPMKVMHGFRAGPPMVAIGALEIMAQHFTNEECFRIRRDIQMKTLLQWMESNRNASSKDRRTLTNELLSGANNTAGAPSQSAYLRMLDWLGRIPFDESELMDLRKYFYDTSGGEGDQKSESNLKHRGDILSALASDVVEEILDSEPLAYSYDDNSVGLDLSILSEDEYAKSEGGPSTRVPEVRMPLTADCMPKSPGEMGEMFGASIEVHGKTDTSSIRMDDLTSFGNSSSAKRLQRSSVSSLSMNLGRATSSSSHSRSHESSRSDSIQFKARITMFPEFAAKLDNLKAVAQEMMDNELDPVQQDVIAQQFAEASLTILRQLRYHCMESGLDGWRQGKLRRKVLIVDDSVVTRKLVARAFEKANFIVDTAENGVEGVNKMKESIYDIAFMDIDMPVMNGFDATKALRMWEDSVRPGARQPICALTAAHVDDFDREELMKFKDAGLDVMESKPCNIPRLFKVVDDVSPMFSDLSINVLSDDGPHFDMVTA